ncbi:MAG: helix-turn-helix domain-containing protein [Solirubrobacteraceae bacterium]
MIRVAPDPDLADVVEQHWIVCWDRRGLPALRHEVLPDPAVNLAVEPSGALLYGVGSGYTVRELQGSGTVVGTKFRPGGFSGFRAEPVSALSGRVLTMSDAFGAAGVQLDAALAAASDVSAIVAVVSAFLRTRRGPPDAHQALVMEILDAMRAAPSGIRVADLAADFAISTRTMQRMFTHHVGASPKQVLQRLRRQRAVDLFGDERPLHLAQLAAELGYFDQAHLARDIRGTLGRNPSAVAASA